MEIISPNMLTETNKLIEYLKNKLLEIDESERESWFRKFISDIKENNPEFISLIQFVACGYFCLYSREVIEQAKQMYITGQVVPGNLNREVQNVLTAIFVIEVFELEIPKELGITINPATAARILSL